MTAFAILRPAEPLGTRGDLINAAVRLFQSRTYSDVSVNDILQATNLPKGSFYHHFPNGKEGLACAALEMIHLDVVSFLKAGLGATMTGPKLLNELSLTIQAWLIETDFQQGALIGCLIAGNPPAALRVKLIEVYDQWINLIALYWPESADAHARAHLVLTTIEGSIAAARLSRNPEFIALPLKQLVFALNCPD